MINHQNKQKMSKTKKHRTRPGYFWIRSVGEDDLTYVRSLKFGLQPVRTTRKPPEPTSDGWAEFKLNPKFETHA